MESKISTFQLGLTFAGCFLGAGYVSGKELWKFFGQYGALGWLGLLFSLCGLGFFGVVILRLASYTGKDNMGELVIPWDVPILRSAVSLFSIVMLFSVVVIMTAGAGAIFYQLFELPPWICSLAFSLLVAIIALAGLSGMLSLFSCVVPVLIVVTVLFSIIALVYLPQSPASSDAEYGWFSASVIFCAYNIFTSIAILAPFGRSINASCAFRGISLGTGLLLLIASPILLALDHCRSQTQAELPMLAIVSRIWVGFGLAYAGLLLLAMLITALSCFLTGANELMVACPSLIPRKKIYLFLLVACTWLASLMGFGNLIDLAYPLFGTISSLCLICLIFHYYSEIRHRSGTGSI